MITPKPRKREPTHPGVVLRSIIEEMGIGQETLAHEIGVTFQTLNAIVNGHRALTAKMAVRLAKRFDMTPESWMNMQSAVDLYRAERALEAHAG